MFGEDLTGCKNVRSCILTLFRQGNLQTCDCDQMKLLPSSRTHICGAASAARGGLGGPSLAVWFAEWVMAVSRAICTGAKAPVTFARGRAAIKETGGSMARIVVQSHCQEQQRSSLPPATPDHQQHTRPLKTGAINQRCGQVKN